MYNNWGKVEGGTEDITSAVDFILEMFARSLSGGLVVRVATPETLIRLLDALCAWHASLPSPPFHEPHIVLPPLFSV